MLTEFRLEHDVIGDKEISVNAYYGIHTLRAFENFQITGHSISSYPGFINALAEIKQAAALTNRDLGQLNTKIADAIVGACLEIQSGNLHEYFIVDVIQGGAGTSTNMNANEVIANRALEILNHRKGEYQFLHPNQHVNMGQSTNDVYPTAIKIATYRDVHRLIDALASLRSAFERKAVEFADILKVGRTQLQDAVPMTLGQEFASFATMIGEDELRLAEAAQLICEINMGATAIGTGIASHPDYAALICRHLRSVTGIPLSTATNLIEATQDCGAFVQISSVLKRVAIKLSKTCHDLRLLSSGPRAGLNEISLPAMQAGSSIMPGKINPVIPELVNQVAFEVIGNDVTVSFAAEAGQLQLNAFEPIIAYSIFKSINHLYRACKTLESRCIVGITANRNQLRDNIDNHLGVITALSPYIGYTNATSVAIEALATDRGIREVILEKKLLNNDQLNKLLHSDVLTKPHHHVDF